MINEYVEFLKRELELDDDTMLKMAVKIFEYITLKRGNGKYNGQLFGVFPGSNEPYVFAAGDAARYFHHALFITEMRESGGEIKKI